MKRKLALALIAAMTVGALAGCGSSSGSSTAGSSTAAQADTTAADVTTESADEAVSALTEAGDTAAASGDLITVGFAQVGHESDWRTASTNSVQAALSKENGIDLQFVDCDNDSAAQLDAVRNFIQQGVDYIVIDPIVSTGWDTVLTEA